MARMTDKSGKKGSDLFYKTTPLIIRSCSDFKITGLGDDIQWEKTDWVTMKRLDPKGEDYESRFKILYSATGIYVLFYGKDNKTTSHFKKNFGKIFQGDVFEVFFQPAPEQAIYFEYEINPSGKELVLLMVKQERALKGWRPWPYEKEDKVKKKVYFSDEDHEIGNKNGFWSAELFFPYSLLHSFRNVPPQSGNIWYANFCRLDYDTGEMVKWAWAPVKESFHELDKYMAVIFE